MTGRRLCSARRTRRDPGGDPRQHDKLDLCQLPGVPPAGADRPAGHEHPVWAAPGVSGGAFFRASVRRALDLPPLWQRARAAAQAVVLAAPVVFETAMGGPVGGAMGSAWPDWPDAPLPDLGEAKQATAAMMHPNPPELLADLDHREVVQLVDDVPPEVIAQLTPQARKLIAKGVAIDLAAAPSAMDQRAAAKFCKTYLRQEPRPAVVADMMVCLCGARGGNQYGLVPAWFGRDCIEARCPLRNAA